MSTLKERLLNPYYQAWIKASLCLIFTKVGLEEFAADHSKTFHKNVLDQLRIKGNPNISQVCKRATVRRGKATCCSNCQDFIDEIKRQNMNNIQFRQENWDNSIMQLWPNDPWEMAKVFMNPGQKPTQRSPGDTDLSGILNFVDHCIIAKNKISHKGNISKVRDARNTVLHSASMALDQKDFTDFATYMIDLLEDPGDLSKSLKAQEATRKVREVMTTDFHITTEDEIRILAEKFEHLENEVMSMKLENEIKKKHEIKTKVSEKARSEEIHRRVNELHDKFAALDRHLETASDIKEQMQSSLIKLGEKFQSLESAMTQGIILIYERLNNLESRTSEQRRQGEVCMSQQTALECRLNSVEKNAQETQMVSSGEDFIKDTRKLQKCLIEEYKRLGFDIPLSPINEDINDKGLRINVDEIYVDLTIVEPEQTLPLKTYKNIFYTKGKRNRIIFLKGEAGVGKSTWCMNLLAAWVRTQDRAEKPFDKNTNMSGCKQQDLEEALSQFEFLLFIPLRYLEDKKSVKEAIFSSTLQSLSDFNSTVKHVIELCSEKVLILLDGLDEYSVDLSYDALNRCTVITTTRPWKYDLFLSKNPRHKVDLVLNIEGLDEKGIETLAKKLYSALYNSSYNDKSLTCRNDAEETGFKGVPNQVQKFLKRVENLGVENCLKVPLILIIMFETFLEKDSLADTKTGILITLLETLVERGERKLSGLERFQTKENTSALFTETSVLSRYSGLLRRLSKLAFVSIVVSENERSLIFSENQVNQYFDQDVLEVCLKFGLITKSRHFVLLLRKPESSYSFYHKVIQEFFAALWIVSNEEAVDILKNFITSIPDVLEIDNVFVFICGLNAYIGSEMTKHFICLCDGDSDIKEYRRSNLNRGLRLIHEHILRNLTEMLLQGQREIKVSGPKVSLYGSDIVAMVPSTDIESRLSKILTESIYYLKSADIVYHSDSVALIRKIFEILLKTVRLQNLKLYCAFTQLDCDLNLKNLTELKSIIIGELTTPAIRIGNLQNLSFFALKNVEMPSTGWKLLFDQLEKLIHLRYFELHCNGCVKRDLNLENCLLLRKLSIKGLKVPAIRIGDLRKLSSIKIQDVIMSSSSLNVLFDQLENLRNVCELELEGIGSVERDLNLENCIDLQKLGIERLNAPAIRFGDLKNLTEIKICDVQIPSSAWKLFFDQLERQNDLSKLKLEGIGSVERDLNLENCFDLERLYIKSLNAPAIRIGDLKNLRNIEIRDVQISSSAWKLLFDQLENQNNLMKLKLEGIGRVERDLNLENCIHLETLYTIGLDAPAIRIGDLKNLFEIKIRDVQISSSAWKLFFGQLERQNNLWILKLEGIGSVERDLNLENCFDLETLCIKSLNAPAIRIGDLKNLFQIKIRDVQISSSAWKLFFGQLERQKNLFELRLEDIGTVECDINLSNCTDLQRLCIKGLNTPAIRIGDLKKLTKIEIRDVQISSSAWKLLFDQLENQNNLMKLKLEGIGRVERDLNLENCIHLETLYTIGLDAPAIRIGDLKNLFEIKIRDVQISSSAWKLFFGQLERQNNLWILKLEGIGSVERDLNLENCFDLEILCIKSLNAPAIRIGDLKNLFQIKIRDVQISSSAWKLFFGQLERQKNLFELRLEDIGTVECDLNLNICTELQRLCIKGLNRPVIRFGDLKKLTKIEIRDVQISSSAWKLFFGQLERQNNLFELKLEDIGTVECDINLSNCTDLQRLCIKGLNTPAIRIGDLKKLTKIEIRDVQISSSAWKLLFDQLENQNNLMKLKLEGIGRVERDLNLENCIHLETLYTIGLDAPAIRIGDLKNLFEIKIRDVQISSSAWKLFFGQLERQNNLWILKLEGIGSVERDLNLENCFDLEILCIKSLNAPAIRIGDLKNLFQIKIRDVQISSSAWKLLFDQLENQNNLMKLKLEGIGRVERDLNLENCIHLETLYTIGLDAPAIRIGDLKNLLEIKIRDVQISSSAWKLFFGQLERQNNLIELKLEDIGTIECDLNLNICTDLQRLCIKGLNTPAIRIGDLKKLTKIEIRDVQISSSAWKLLFDQLENQNNLMKLKLEGIGRVERDLNLENCIHLETLYTIGLDAPAIRIGDLKNLFEIKIRDVQISSSAWKLFFGQLERQNDLWKLKLEGIGSVERDLNLENCFDLEILCIKSLNAPAIRIGDLKNLFQIKIRDVQISSSAWKLFFGQLERQNNLIELKLEDIGTVECDLNLNNCTDLQRLCIKGLNTPAIRIGDLKKLTKIEIL